MAYIKRNPWWISDLAYNLTIRREHLPHRAFALIGKDTAENVSSYPKVPAKTSGITMIFGGRGAQWPGIGVDLLRTNAEFETTLGAWIAFFRASSEATPAMDN